MADYASGLPRRLFSSQTFTTPQEIIDGWNFRVRLPSSELSRLTPMCALYAVYESRDILPNIGRIQENLIEAIIYRGNSSSRIYLIPIASNFSQGTLESKPFADIEHIRRGGTGIESAALNFGVAEAGNFRVTVNLMVGHLGEFARNPALSRLIFFNEKFLLLWGWSGQQSIQFDTGVNSGVNTSNPGLAGDNNIFISFDDNHSGFWKVTEMSLYSYDFNFDEYGRLGIQTEFFAVANSSMTFRKIEGAYSSGLRGLLTDKFHYISSSILRGSDGTIRSDIDLSMLRRNPSYIEAQASLRGLLSSNDLFNTSQRISRFDLFTRQSVGETEIEGYKYESRFVDPTESPGAVVDLIEFVIRDMARTTVVAEDSLSDDRRVALRRREIHPLDILFPMEVRSFTGNKSTEIERRDAITTLRNLGPGRNIDDIGIDISNTINQFSQDVYQTPANQNPSFSIGERYSGSTNSKIHPDDISITVFSRKEAQESVYEIGGKKRFCKVRDKLYSYILATQDDAYPEIAMSKLTDPETVGFFKNGENAELRVQNVYFGLRRGRAAIHAADDKSLINERYDYAPPILTNGVARFFDHVFPSIYIHYEISKNVSIVSSDQNSIKPVYLGLVPTEPIILRGTINNVTHVQGFRDSVKDTLIVQTSDSKYKLRYSMIIDGSPISDIPIVRIGFPIDPSTSKIYPLTTFHDFLPFEIMNEEVSSLGEPRAYVATFVDQQLETLKDFFDPTKRFHYTDPDQKDLLILHLPLVFPCGFYGDSEDGFYFWPGPIGISFFNRILDLPRFMHGSGRTSIGVNFSLLERMAYASKVISFLTWVSTENEFGLFRGDDSRTVVKELGFGPRGNLSILPTDTKAQVLGTVLRLYESHVNGTINVINRKALRKVDPSLFNRAQGDTSLGIISEELSNLIDNLDTVVAMKSMEQIKTKKKNKKQPG